MVPSLPRIAQSRNAGAMDMLGPYLRLHEAGSQATTMFLFTDFRLARLCWLLSVPLVSQNDKNSHFSLMESVLKKQCANQHCLELGCTLLTANSAPHYVVPLELTTELGTSGTPEHLHSKEPGAWTMVPAPQRAQEQGPWIISPCPLRTGNI